MRHRAVAWTALVQLGAWASGAAAQTTLTIGQMVKGSGDTDQACVQRSDLRTYKSAGAACAFGDVDGCHTAKKLEDGKACGVRAASYVVVSVDADAGLIQISPTNDPAKVYWADADDFDPGQ
jgi:hypothetical protein